MKYIIITFLLAFNSCNCNLKPYPPTEIVKFKSGKSNYYHRVFYMTGGELIRAIRFENLEIDCNGDSSYTAVHDTIIDAVNTLNF